MTESTVFYQDSSTFTKSHDTAWDFTDQVVIVTGAARGQGAEHAKAFAEYGANVVLLDICAPLPHMRYPSSTLEELQGVAKIVRDFGVEAVEEVCDLREADQVKAVVDRTIDRFGKIDVIASSAGTAGLSPVFEMPLDMWEQSFATNLRPTYYLCKYAGPHMIAAGYGRIIATGSTQALGSINEMAHYTAAKHGLYGLVKAFAQEVASHGVTINLINPSAVDTPMNASPRTDARTAWAAEAGRLVGAWNLLQDNMFHAREITEGLLFLASRESGYINGTALMVDAGCMSK